MGQLPIQDVLGLLEFISTVKSSISSNACLTAHKVYYSTQPEEF